MSKQLNLFEILNQSRKRKESPIQFPTTTKKSPASQVFKSTEEKILISLQSSPTYEGTGFV